MKRKEKKTNKWYSATIISQTIWKVSLLQTFYLNILVFAATICWSLLTINSKLNSMEGQPA
jgi:hypothetical protein